MYTYIINHAFRVESNGKIVRPTVLKMVTILAEASNETNNEIKIFLMSNLYFKKFKQFCLGKLLKNILFKYRNPSPSLPWEIISVPVVRPAYGTTGLLLVSHGKGLVFRVITQE